MKTHVNNFYIVDVNTDVMYNDGWAGLLIKMHMYHWNFITGMLPGWLCYGVTTKTMLYSGKLSREKTFAYFTVLCLSYLRDC